MFLKIIATHNITAEVILMVNRKTNVTCKNIFKHIHEEDIKKGFTDKWVQIIKHLEESPQRA